MWNGNPAQAQSFKNNTGITYPLLRLAATVGQAYSSGWDFTFVVDPSGTITLKDTTGFLAGPVGLEIDRLLALIPTAADDRLASPSLHLDPLRPNPFNPRTTVSYRLEGEGSAQVSVEVFDLRGRLVAVVEAGLRARGDSYSVPWDGTQVDGTPAPSGVYVVRVRADDERQTQRAALVK